MARMAFSSPATNCCMSSCSDWGESGPSLLKVKRPPLGIRRPRCEEFVCRHYPPHPASSLGARPLGRWDDGGMSKGRALVLILASLAWLGALASQAGGAGAQASTPTVLSLQLKGVVDPFMASYVERGIKEASRNGDAAVLLTIDTPGGLDSSMRQIIESILASPTEVICYASPSGARAASAGTFIMMGCPINAMAPGTNVGAAHPVGVSGAIEMEKVTNDAAAFIRSLAERWHRNADWAEQSVRNAVSASAEDALSMHVVDLVAPSQTALFDNIAACLQGTGPCPSTGDLPQIKGTAAGQALTGLSAAAVTPYGMSITER